METSLHITLLQFTDDCASRRWDNSPCHNSHNASVIRCLLVRVPAKWTQILILCYTMSIYIRGTFSRNRNRKTPYYWCIMGNVMNWMRTYNLCLWWLKLIGQWLYLTGGLRQLLCDWLQMSGVGLGFGYTQQRDHVHLSTQHTATEIFQIITLFSQHA